MDDIGVRPFGSLAWVLILNTSSMDLVAEFYEQYTRQGLECRPPKVGFQGWIRGLIGRDIDINKPPTAMVGDQQRNTLRL